jgi:hypothetical protein
MKIILLVLTTFQAKLFGEVYTFKCIQYIVLMLRINCPTNKASIMD